jgi:hypothetical protein
LTRFQEKCAHGEKFVCVRVFRLATNHFPEALRCCWAWLSQIGLLMIRRPPQHNPLTCRWNCELLYARLRACVWFDGNNARARSQHIIYVDQPANPSSIRPRSAAGFPVTSLEINRCRFYCVGNSEPVLVKYVHVEDFLSRRFGDNILRMRNQPAFKFPRRIVTRVIEVHTHLRNFSVGGALYAECQLCLWIAKVNSFELLQENYLWHVIGKNRKQNTQCPDISKKINKTPERYNFI